MNSNLFSFLLLLIEIKSSWPMELRHPVKRFKSPLFGDGINRKTWPWNLEWSRAGHSGNRSNMVASWTETNWQPPPKSAQPQVRLELTVFRLWDWRTNRMRNQHTEMVYVLHSVFEMRTTILLQATVKARGKSVNTIMWMLRNQGWNFGAHFVFCPHFLASNVYSY